MNKIIYKKTYDGFEDLSDFHRDMSEVFDERFNSAAKDIPGEFQGKVIVTITYTGEDETETR